MVSNVSAGIGGSSRVGGGAGIQGQINGILSQIKDMRKQLTTLQKQLTESTDPDTRKILMKEIMEIQRTIVLLQQQITMIEANEQRKAEAREQAALLHAQEAARNEKKKEAQ